jgi:hypothetical protein
MPAAYVEKLAKKHKISIDKAEEYWAEAKKQAKKQNQEDNFAYITSIFKNMMNESFTFKDYLSLTE